ncbi:RBBP9/YdeN family alpha/beta hydrolase [Microbacterium endophyticum]|uniref:RBBP9/YdeN family alpha/beta hydrolase n=1 Tax=Microbacterium endophyticum TaxID=1526412 RepID=UPI001F49A24B|nr:alpha/beta hydrolase [Microbacterium endophyticum]
MHGYGASPEAHWFPWLARVLRAADIDVVVVRLPQPLAPESSRWNAEVRDALGAPTETTWIVAHSLGAITTLRVLADLPTHWTLGGLVLVSGFTGRLAALPDLDSYLKDDVAVEDIATRIGERVMIRSDSDDYVPIEASDELAARLGAETVIVPDAVHFLDENGVTEFPQLARLLLSPANR